MSKTVTIPSYTSPYWECCINGVRHMYPSGSTQEVPDAVAAFIEEYMERQPKKPVSAKHVGYDLVISCSDNFGSSVTAASFLVEHGDAETVIAKMEKGQTPQVRIYAQQKYEGGIYFDEAVIYRVFVAGDKLGIVGVCNAGRLSVTINKDNLGIRSAIVTEW